MFGEKERNLRVIEQNPTTLLDRGCQFEGKLTFEGSVQINGKFRGEIFSDGTLVIGEGAEVEGKIEIDSVIISGQVNGTIHAKRKIEMHPPAFVQADIITQALVVQDGAVFEGNCSMGKRQGERQEPESASLYDFGSGN
ncbi:MAG: polymer-forming cytoskeletal protein [bacterium]